MVASTFSWSSFLRLRWSLVAHRLARIRIAVEEAPLLGAEAPEPGPEQNVLAHIRTSLRPIALASAASHQQPSRDPMPDASSSAVDLGVVPAAEPAPQEAA